MYYFCATSGAVFVTISISVRCNGKWHRFVKSYMPERSVTATVTNTLVRDFVLNFTFTQNLFKNRSYHLIVISFFPGLPCCTRERDKNVKTNLLHFKLFSSTLFCKSSASIQVIEFFQRSLWWIWSYPRMTDLLLRKLRQFTGHILGNFSVLWDFTKMHTLISKTKRYSIKIYLSQLTAYNHTTGLEIMNL